MFTIDKSYRPIKIWTHDLASVEAGALDQLINTARLPIVAKEGIAVMPDVHFGIGATIGSVVPTIDAIIPAAVGVDIGCGMAWYGSEVPADCVAEKLPLIRNSIERTVPVGAGKLPTKSQKLWNENLDARFKRLIEKHTKLKQNSHPVMQLGTLGGGNHFIEVVVDQNNKLGVMLHSGSRGIGNLIGRYFIERAKLEIEILGIKLPDKDLSYLSKSTASYDDYCEAVSWAQDYAMYNRTVMLEQVVAQVEYHIPHEYKKLWEAAEHRVHCHHNYVSFERHFDQDMIVTRKGAVDASEGKMVIIPGSMGVKSFIARGKGNKDSYHSCSHGAGRRMSRGDAKRQFTIQDLATQTSGVECRKDAGVLDEIPGAYKDIDLVMQAQQDLIETVFELKQLICVKG